MGGGASIVIFFGSMFYFPSIRISRIDHNGSIFHFESIIFKGAEGGVHLFHFLSMRVSIAENSGSTFHFDSIIFSGGGGEARH